MPVVQVGDICYVSGHGPVQTEGTMITGKVGEEMSEEEANAAARVFGWPSSPPSGPPGAWTASPVSSRCGDGQLHSGLRNPATGHQRFQ
ncbi:MAG: hypothetical protein Ct9H300mP1_39590 [Planctomycetaceae bacterium]|nr:MAG: hypothetical protein Ct9H300mP1_39590 [Planctomycetaceae bacterium]